MQEDLERIMKRIFLLVSNCKESEYSKEDIIVPKARLFALLEELNYAVYDMMEKYEATAASRDRAMADQEHKMAQVKEDAERRAEDTYAASLLCARDMLLEMQRVTEKMCQGIRKEYDIAMKDCEDRLKFIHENEESTVDQIRSMTESKKYLRLIEQQNREKDEAHELTEEEKKEREARAEELREIAQAEAATELNRKLAAPIVVQVHEQPKLPEGFDKKQGKKKKYTPNANLEETVVEGEGVVDPEAATSAELSAELDQEYFDWKNEQNPDKDKKPKGIRGLLKKK